VDYDCKKRQLCPRIGRTVSFTFRRIDTDCRMDRPFGLRLPEADRLLIRCLGGAADGSAKLLVRRSIIQNNFVDFRIRPELSCTIPIMVFELGRSNGGMHDIIAVFSAWNNGCLDAKSRFPRMVPTSQKYLSRRNGSSICHRMSDLPGQ
jgi:hypothetical protein